MRALHFRKTAFTFVAGVTLAGCTGFYGGYGSFGGNSGLSVGVSSGGYYDPYYGDWRYYRSNPYWGWYDGFYYPGTGLYVFDTNRRPHRWTTTQQSYWTSRQSYWQSRDDFRQSRREMRENWGDFQRGRPNAVRQSRALRPPENGP